MMSSEMLLKERQVVPAKKSMPLMSSTAAPAVQTILSQLEIKSENLPCMVAGIFSNDSNIQLEATTLLRKLFSIEGSPPIDEVIQSGVVPLLVDFVLRREDFSWLQFEAGWALTNIVSAAGTCENGSRVAIDHVGVPFFVKLLASPFFVDLRDEAVCWLGKVAGRSPGYRDLVLSQGALIPLLSRLNDEYAKLSMLRNATFTLLKFLQGEPHPTFELTKQAVVTALKRLFVDSHDEEVLTNTCWALLYLSADGSKIQAVIEAGFCQLLVELLQHPSPSVVISALLTVGNIVTGVAAHTQVIEAELIAPVLNLTQTAGFDIKKKFAWAISKATSGGDNEQIKYLVNQGCIKPLCDLLSNPDPMIVGVCLEGLEKILKAGEVLDEKKNVEEVNLFGQLIDEAGGLEKIENLQSHDNHEINEKAVKILETYYWLEEDQEDDEPVEKFRCFCTKWIQLIWRKF